ncbi:MAG TPA: CHASE2 domain-containing protein [Leptolyngbyaceae cyanobacterium M33_DOE_097]|uniref:non-specific serine/threonine protein kinase n=1 Tax=Oscillatoriales cyanobacterium SpSt-418 TaxID=2282169 RepID=A0A7C3PL27_9CYAN|nr:CHASE2 domain-containing protein [Leptolyngbyaceae cyanobacterium M33_DOE_097]
MPEKPSHQQTETLSVNLPTTVHQQSVTRTVTSVQARRTAKLGHWLMGLWALAGAMLAGSQSNLSQMLERQAQIWFFELRGPVAAPPEIVILGLDEDSTMQGTQIYPTDPQKFADLEPLQNAPPKRSAYAIAIDRLMQAGAKAIAVDVVMDAVGSDPKADQHLSQVLAKYPNRVTLAAQFDTVLTDSGQRTQVITPNPIFESASLSIGHINFSPAANGKIHSLGNQYPKLVAQTYPPEIAADFLENSGQLPSFAEAVLKAANLPFDPNHGTDIFYYGPKDTFRHIPIWHVLDRENWQKYLKEGAFKDKIVLIGPTAANYRDFHSAPFSGTFRYPNQMTGIEINANAIATLLYNRAISTAIPHPWGQAAYVLVLVLGAGWLQSRAQRSPVQLALSSAMVLGVALVSYGVFTYGYRILPAAVPMGAIAASGVTYFLTQTVSDYLRRLQLRQTLAQYANSPIVQEIISQQEDLQDILSQREKAVFGKLLANRYRIVKVLGSGGFSETYISEDIHRPGNPICVVKHLRLISDNPKLLKLARLLFQREANTLERLGKHDRIPQLLAYFEEAGEFYLVQEFIAGHPLSTELRIGIPLPEVRVVAIMKELLEILEFVHGQNVIHRDIKPSNVIRRKSDHKLVLIDFGAVKEISALVDEPEQSSVTVGIGTKGFMPNEQYAGNPRFNSDIYAIGMTGIQALTGLPPSNLKTDPQTGEVLWRDRTQVSRVLADVISKMVLYDFTKRYQSVQEVLQDLEKVESASVATNWAFEAIPAGERPAPANEPVTLSEEDPFFYAPTRQWLSTSPTSDVVEAMQEVDEYQAEREINEEKEK